MTKTEYAIAKMYYRLVYDLQTLKIKDIPKEYRQIFDDYRKEVAKK